MAAPPAPRARAIPARPGTPPPGAQKRPRLLRREIPRALDERFGEPEAAGHVQRVACAGNTGAEDEAGREPLEVELERAVHHAGHLARDALQAPEVRGQHAPCAACRGMLPECP